MSLYDLIELYRADLVSRKYSASGKVLAESTIDKCISNLNSLKLAFGPKLEFRKTNTRLMNRRYLTGAWDDVIRDYNAAYRVHRAITAVARYAYDVGISKHRKSYTSPVAIDKPNSNHFTRMYSIDFGYGQQKTKVYVSSLLKGKK